MNYVQDDSYYIANICIILKEMSENMAVSMAEIKKNARNISDQGIKEDVLNEINGYEIQNMARDIERLSRDLQIYI